MVLGTWKRRNRSFLSGNQSQASTKLLQHYGAAQLQLETSPRAGRNPRQAKHPNFAEDLPKDLGSPAAVWNLKKTLQNTLAQHVVKGASGISAEQEKLVNDLGDRYGRQKLKESKGNLIEAKRLVDLELEQQRNIWRKRWLYYGTEPNLLSTNEQVRAIEKEIWALWILENFDIIKRRCREDSLEKRCRGGEFVGNFKEHTGSIRDGGGGYRNGRRTGSYDANVVSDFIHEKVTDRLVTLGIAAASTFGQIAKRSIEKRERRRNGKPLLQRANLNVVGTIDTVYELRRLRSWALHHDVTLVSNKSMPVKERKLPRIDQLFAQAQR